MIVETRICTTHAGNVRIGYRLKALPKSKIYKGSASGIDPKRKLSAEGFDSKLSPRGSIEVRLGQNPVWLRRTPHYRRKRILMNGLSDEDMARYCSRLEVFNTSAAAREGAVRSLHLILNTIIDAALGKSGTDLAIQERSLRKAFQEASGRDSVSARKKRTSLRVKRDPLPQNPNTVEEKSHDL